MQVLDVEEYVHIKRLLRIVAEFEDPLDCREPEIARLQSSKTLFVLRESGATVGDKQVGVLFGLRPDLGHLVILWVGIRPPTGIPEEAVVLAEVLLNLHAGQ